MWCGIKPFLIISKWNKYGIKNITSLRHTIHSQTIRMFHYSEAGRQVRI